MQDKEIKEGNKLIAEFMGWEIKSNRALQHDDYGIVRGMLLTDLPFNKSWDELMPVVENIEIVHYSNYSVCIMKDSCDISLSTKYTIAGDDIDAPSFEKNKTTKLISTFESVVEFIKWYNQNKL